jgi:hypothetical protein
VVAAVAVAPKLRRLLRGKPCRFALFRRLMQRLAVEQRAAAVVAGALDRDVAVVVEAAAPVLLLRNNLR